MAGRARFYVLWITRGSAKRWEGPYDDKATASEYARYLRITVGDGARPLVLRKDES
jgi:hypothetical protein